MKKLTYLFILLCLFAGCTSKQAQDVCLYADSNSWYQNGKSIDKTKADVFYILPTCVFDWTDNNGELHHYASMTDPEQRSRMLPSYQLADEIFGDDANFFAPYYRHITMDTWAEGEEAVAERFPYAMDDIREAFHYYMEHWNEGRPFVLAGFSQGAKCVVELIKEMDPQTYTQLVAGYVCGYRVTYEDIASTHNLRPAHSADDTGVVIVYNTVTGPEGVNPLLSGGNEFVINPASWSTDTDIHPLNDSVSISIDPIDKVVVAHGIDPESAYIPKLGNMFPMGNLHLQELTLYKESLKANVKNRISKFN